MSIRLNSICVTAAFGAAALALLATAPARAESVTKQCAAKWQAAKAANQTGGDTYLQFYSKCSAEIKAQNAAPVAPTVTAPAAPVAPAAPTIATTPGAAKPLRPAAQAAPAAPAASGSAVFPAAVNPAYASEKPGKARQKTCLDQYNANKAAGGNGGLTWIQKGGGYYSECNRKLKGE